MKFIMKSEYEIIACVINVKINNSSSVYIYVIRIVLVKEMNAVCMSIRVFRFLY